MTLYPDGRAEVAPVRGGLAMGPRPIRLTWDAEFDLLYGGYDGANPGAGAEEPVPGLIIERDRKGTITGFLLLDAARLSWEPAILDALAARGFPPLPLDTLPWDPSRGAP